MIDMRQIRFRYRRKAPLFNGLDFSVQPGGVVGLLGKNGTGKTSLLKIGAGLLFPSGGTAELFGRPAFARDPEALARTVFIPEQFEVSSERLKEYVDYRQGYYPRFDRTLMENYLQRFEISGNERLKQLSFGQQKKVLLSFALATMAELVILDEPTNGLDIPSKHVFRQLVAEAADDQRTVVISTHQVRDVEDLIDPIVVLDGGRIVFESGLGAIRESVAMCHFASESEAVNAGALAWASRLGSSVALVPRRRGGEIAGVQDAAGELAGDAIDIELLFWAAITHSERLSLLCGGTS